MGAQKSISINHFSLKRIYVKQILLYCQNLRLAEDFAVTLRYNRQIVPLFNFDSESMLELVRAIFNGK